jgi:hypothetical protein
MQRVTTKASTFHLPFTGVVLGSRGEFCASRLETLESMCCQPSLSLSTQAIKPGTGTIYLPLMPNLLEAQQPSNVALWAAQHWFRTVDNRPLLFFR